MPRRLQVDKRGGERAGREAGRDALRDARSKKPLDARRIQEHDHARGLDGQRREDHRSPPDCVGKRTGEEKRDKKSDRIHAEDLGQRHRREVPPRGVNGIQRRRRRRRE